MVRAERRALTDAPGPTPDDERASRDGERAQQDGEPVSTDAELARGLVAVALVIGFVIWFAFTFLLQGCGTVPARG